MRYYRIEIDGGSTVYTSYSNGVNDRGALQIEMNIPVYPMHVPAGSAFVRIWGIPLATIAQAKDLNFKTIKVFGGFQKGLPLANPAQAGLLVQGYIFQAFGNWEGTSMSLDMYIKVGDGPQAGKKRNSPTNLVLNWKKGATLQSALTSTLQTAYSGFTSTFNINPQLVLPSDETGFFDTLEQLAQYVKTTSLNIIGGTTYNGVDITISGQKFVVQDGSAAASTTKTVAFNDLIGQPTWIASPNITFKCPMRADLQVGDAVTMPKTLVTNSSQAQTSLVNQSAAFQGNFRISSVHHFGNFRQPIADSWATVFEAYPITVQSAK